MASQGLAASFLASVGIPRDHRMGASFARSCRRAARAGAFQSLETQSRRAIRAASLLLILLVVGCSGPVRNSAEPAKLADQATVLDIPNVRFFPDTQVDAMVQ